MPISSLADLLDEARKLHYSRRALLKRSSQIGIAAAFAAIPCQKPTFARARDPVPPELRIVLASIPIAGANDFTAELAQAWGNQNGVVVTIAFETLRDLPARVDRILHGGEQQDIVELQDLQPFRHSDNLVDLSHLVEPLMLDQGGYFDWAIDPVRVRGQWLSLPIGTSSLAVTYRPSFLQAIGIADPTTQFPGTWTELFDVATRLKRELGKPAGQAVGQTPFDSPGFCNAYMWSHGASEIEPNSRGVAFNSPELSEALQAFSSAWKQGFDEHGTGWDDDSNAEAFLADRISMTLGGPEIYQQALLGPIPDIASDIAIAPVPAGPAGTFIPLGSRSLGISSRSDVPDLAAQFLSWWLSLAQYSQWLIAQKGCLIPAGPALLTIPVFTGNSNMQPFVEALDSGRIKGYSAAPSRSSAEVAANYFVVNTFADAARGVDIATALDRGQRLMEQFYTQAS